MNIEDSGIQKLLVIEPHPDDMILMCGGLVKGLTEIGSEVYVVTFTCGSSKYTDELRSAREQESSKADKILGITNRDIWKYETRRCIANHESLYEDLIEAVRKIRPDTIITMNHDKKHPDHMWIATYIEAVAFQASEPILEELGDPISTQVYLGENPRANIIDPTHIFDISRTYEYKEQAMKTQTTQIPVLGEDALFKAMNNLADRRGNHCKPAVQYGEAFQKLHFDCWPG